VKDKKRDVLLSSYGPTTYTLIKNIVAPKKPAEIPYADFEKTIGSPYNPEGELSSNAVFVQLSRMKRGRITC